WPRGVRASRGSRAPLSEELASLSAGRASADRLDLPADQLIQATMDCRFPGGVDLGPSLLIDLLERECCDFALVRIEGPALGDVVLQPRRHAPSLRVRGAGSQGHAPPSPSSRR